MRISDLSSDVCSADLNAHDFHLRPRQLGSRCRLWKIPLRDASSQDGIVAPTVDGFGISRTYGAYGGATVYCRVAVGEEPRSAGVRRGDRKSVVSGKSVSVRVDLGGRRIIKKKQIL